MRKLMVTLVLLLVGCGDDPGVVNGVLPPPFQDVIDSPQKVIEALERAYQARNYDKFLELLVDDPARNAEFLFILSEATEEGETQWDFVVEARLHRRMFNPEDTSPGELPVPVALWLQSIDITLTQLSDWTERTEFYTNDGGADGLLDPSGWKATSALYATDVFFEMTGDIDYQVTGMANFVIVEDLTKENGDMGRFLLLLWEDIGAPGKADFAPLQSDTWSNVKNLYR